MVKKILTILLTAVLLLGVTTVAYAQPVENVPHTAQAILSNGFNEVCSNEKLTFFVHSENYEVALKENNTGKIWFSNPQDRENDKLALGKNKMNLSSAFEVTYRDVERAVTDNIGTYTGAIMNGAVKVETKKNGIKLYYRFNDIKAIIPIQYTLHKDSLSCSVLVNEIVENEMYPVLSISLLSYFGAGSSSDEGYMLVPDGSGSLINFNNGKQAEAIYSQKLYGRDEAFDLSSLNINTQSAKLPVFGIKCNNNGILAVITEGDALATVSACVGGKLSSYNRVSASFALRQMDTYSMGQGQGQTGNEIIIYDEGPLPSDNITVRYFPLSTEKSNYSGMAQKYKEYLVENKVLTLGKTSQQMHLEFMGAMRVQEYFLGIPYKKNVVLTDTKAIDSVLSEIRTQTEVPISVKYTDWNKYEVKGSIPSKASILSSLGGKSGIKELIEKYSNDNVKIYLDVDFYKVSDFPTFSNEKNSGVTTLSGKPLTLYDFSIIDYFKDPYSKAQYLISFRKLEKYAKKFKKSFDKMPDELNISLGNMVGSLYSDYSIEGWTRQDSSNNVANIVKLFSGEKETMLKGANAYSLYGCNAVIDAPSKSSNFDMTDESVPFYALVMNGLAEYSYSPINLSSEPHKQFLKAIETGASLHFLLVDKNSSYLNEQGHSSNYSVKCSDWLEKAINYAKEIESLSNAISGSTIESHSKIQTDVYKTVYTNGTFVIVNYNANAVNVDGIKVDAEDYVVMKGSATE